MNPGFFTVVRLLQTESLSRLVSKVPKLSCVVWYELDAVDRKSDIVNILSKLMGSSLDRLEPIEVKRVGFYWLSS